MSIDNHKNLREDNTSMLLFGNGDGGGGPLPAMVRAYSDFHTCAYDTQTDRKVTPPAGIS